MKKTLLMISFFLFCFSLGIPIPGQFTHREISGREQWEEFLTTAEIVKFERIPKGVTKPWKLYLRKGDIEKKAAWKNVDLDQTGEDKVLY